MTGERLDEAIDRVASELTKLRSHAAVSASLTARLEQSRFRLGAWMTAPVAVTAVILMIVGITSLRHGDPAAPEATRAAIAPRLHESTRQRPWAPIAPPAVERVARPAPARRAPRADADAPPMPQIAALRTPERLNIDALSVDSLTVTPVALSDLDLVGLDVPGLDRPSELKEQE